MNLEGTGYGQLMAWPLAWTDWKTRLFGHFIENHRKNKYNIWRDSDM